MPYILYLLGAVAQDNCHCHLSSSEDIGARTRGGRALCAYLFVSELRFSLTCGGMLPRLRKMFVSLSMNVL